jgi:hypothetical protein
MMGRWHHGSGWFLSGAGRALRKERRERKE